ncbi:MAG: adenosylmethionine decarboxylase [Sulfolobales archaeon]|nr:adenosylmethionine decarboxylase [Sulfolobales archaeon]MCX8185579.1 adenosylmethionine decarboxylase [Sulfolobales archaeon]MDW7969522.1 adenosylmethionine decarboxylase [Sulfolobales archaeon]
MMGVQTLLRFEGVQTTYKVIGKHVYGNLYECDSNILSNAEYLSDVVIKAAREGNMTLLDVKYWKIEPGVSIVAIILESHITIHTWPEYNFATVDVYSCGLHTDPEAAFKYIVNALKAEKCEYKVVDRSLHQT